jgi:hypothetical protein
VIRFEHECELLTHSFVVSSVLVDRDGVSSFEVLACDLPLHLIVGRPIAIYEEEDDLGTSLCDCATKDSSGETRTRGFGCMQQCQFGLKTCAAIQSQAHVRREKQNRGTSIVSFG